MFQERLSVVENDFCCPHMDGISCVNLYFDYYYNNYYLYIMHMNGHGHTHPSNSRAEHNDIRH